YDHTEVAGLRFVGQYSRFAKGLEQRAGDGPRLRSPHGNDGERGDTGRSQARGISREFAHPKPSAAIQMPSSVISGQGMTQESITGASSSASPPVKKTTGSVALHCMRCGPLAQRARAANWRSTALIPPAIAQKIPALIAPLVELPGSGGLVQSISTTGNKAV